MSLPQLDLDIEKLISNRDDEVKRAFNSKINTLTATLAEKNLEIQNLNSTLEKLKTDFNFNLNLIEERDEDLKLYEDKIDSFNVLLVDKDKQIKNLEAQINELNLKHQNDKIKRENNEELLKFNISKINNTHKEEVKTLNKTIDELRKELMIVKDDNRLKFDEFKRTNENEKRKLTEEVEHLNTKITKLKEINEEDRLRKELENLNINFNRINMENLNLIKEKILMENKIKIFETNENEGNVNNFVTSERNKFLTKQIEELKLNISTKDYKIENLNKQIAEKDSDINNFKQKLQIKEFDLDNKICKEKQQNDKIRDLNYQIDKLIEEKRTLCRENEDRIYLEGKNKINLEENMSLKFNMGKLQDEMNKLKEELDEKNKKIKELTNINNNNILNDQLNSHKKEDTTDLLDFFNKGEAQMAQNPNNKNNNEKELQMEIDRLHNELNGAKDIMTKYESDVNQIHQKFKENEFNLTVKIKELQQELEKLYAAKKSIDLSYNKDNKEEINSLNEIIKSYKIEIKIKNDLIEKFKDTLKEKQNEIGKIKKEREKMAAQCRNLRAQVNQIENHNHLMNNQEQERENLELNYQSNYYSNNNVNLDNSVVSNYFSEYEEYQQRKNQILNSKNINLEIKKEANAHIKNIMNKNESNGLNPRKNKFLSSTISDEEVRSSQEKPQYKKYYEVMTKAKSPSRSRSTSKSPLPSENLLEAVKISKIDTSSYINKNGLKLLKRERNKSENK